MVTPAETLLQPQFRRPGSCKGQRSSQQQPRSEAADTRQLHSQQQEPSGILLKYACFIPGSTTIYLAIKSMLS